MNRPEVRKKLAAASKSAWGRPEARKKMVAANRKRAKKYFFGGNKLTLRELANAANIHAGSLRKRLAKGEPVDLAVAALIQHNSALSISELARRADLNPETVHGRLRLGWTLEEALSGTRKKG